MEINVDQHVKATYRHVYSRTPKMERLRYKSNFNKPGQFAFEISTENIVEPFDWRKKETYEKSSML